MRLTLRFEHLSSTAARATTTTINPTMPETASFPQSSLTELQADDLSTALKGAYLATYEHALRDLGCVELEDLSSLDDEDLMEIGMKKIEIKRLRRMCTGQTP